LEVFVERVINLDNRLIADAMSLSGLQNIEGVVGLSLAMFVKTRLKKQEFIRRYKGKLIASSEEVHLRRAEIRAVK
jgi:hypothetical protein